MVRYSANVMTVTLKVYSMHLDAFWQGFIVCKGPHTMIAARLNQWPGDIVDGLHWAPVSALTAMQFTLLSHSIGSGELCRRVQRHHYGFSEEFDPFA